MSRHQNQTLIARVAVKTPDRLRQAAYWAYCSPPAGGEPPIRDAHGAAPRQAWEG